MLITPVTIRCRNRAHGLFPLVANMPIHQLRTSPEAFLGQLSTSPIHSSIRCQNHSIFFMPLIADVASRTIASRTGDPGMTDPFHTGFHTLRRSELPPFSVNKLQMGT